MMTGYFRGQEVGSGTDFWRYSYEVRHGRMSVDEYRDFEASLCRSHGHCMEMATAMSMAVVGEALGIALTDTASIPAVDARRHVLCERAGALAVQIAKDGLTPREVMSKEAFEKRHSRHTGDRASTNSVVHMLALAGRLGVDLTLEDFTAASHIPVLANLRPSGEHLLERFYHAGGVAAVMTELGDLLHRDLMTVTARPWQATSRVVATMIKKSSARSTIRWHHRARSRWYGDRLAPDGAVIKRSAAAVRLMRHRGPAFVFEDVEELARRLDDPDLDVTADSVLVLKGAGPLGGPGMPEWGHIPIPGKLSQTGVEDMVRISDGRISGGSTARWSSTFRPKQLRWGPIAAVKTGDMILLDVDAGSLELEVEPDEIARATRGPPGSGAALPARLWRDLHGQRAAGRRRLRLRDAASA
jgi:dihydroxy-acid dehydratase